MTGGSSYDGDSAKSEPAATSKDQTHSSYQSKDAIHSNVFSSNPNISGGSYENKSSLRKHSSLPKTSHSGSDGLEEDQERISMASAARESKSWLNDNESLGTQNMPPLNLSTGPKQSGSNRDKLVSDFDEASLGNRSLSGASAKSMSLLGNNNNNESSDIFTTMFIVPPKLKDGDFLSPFQFDVFGGTKTFYFFGRYNEEKDTCEFVLTGSAGSAYKLCLSDGNSPYGWKVKRHGVTKTNPAKEDKGQSLNASESQQKDKSYVSSHSSKAKAAESDDYNASAGGANSDNESTVTVSGDARDRIRERAYKDEETVAVPHAMMRSSSRLGIMDAKYECIKPWSFYGPSLPEYFCRCKLKVIVYADEDEHTDKLQTAEQTMEDEGGLSAQSNEISGSGAQPLQLQADDFGKSGESPWESNYLSRGFSEASKFTVDISSDFCFPPPPRSLYSDNSVL